MSEPAGSPQPSPRSLRGLDWLNFFLADVQTGVGPFLAIYLAGHHWNEEQVGVALTVGGLAGIVTQTPLGALVDAVRARRLLIAGGVLFLATGALVIALFPQLAPVLAAQAVIGGASSVFIPAICAISIGLVGREAFDARQGRNQGFNSAGNVVAAVAMGLLAWRVSDRAIFFLVAAIAVPTLFSLTRIKADEIDNARARGAAEGEATGSKLAAVFADKPLAVFLVCAVLFHFANAAMLPLVGEHIAKGRGRSSMLFMSACIVTTQLVIAILAAWCGRNASRWGRKPFLLVAFAVLPIRGVLYTLTDRVPLLVAIQVLDGVGAGIFGVVSVLVIADRTGKTGRFNLVLGAVTTAVGIGAALSQVIAGAIVHRVSFTAGMLFLSAVAAVALAVLFIWMPETYSAADAAKRNI